MTTVSKLCNVINTLEDCGCLLEEEHQSYVEIMRDYDENALVRKMIAKAAALSFRNNETLCDEFMELFPKKVQNENFERIWETLDDEFKMLFGMSVTEAERYGE